MSQAGGGGAEAHAPFKQYEYRANSSLVLTTDSRPRDTHDHEPETLWGMIDPRSFGDRTARGKPPELEEKKKSKRKMEEAPAEEEVKKSTKKGRWGEEESDLFLAEDDAAHRPKTKETRASLLPSSQKKTLFLSFYKTIIYATITRPEGGYDFTLDLVMKDKTWIVYVILRPGLDEFLQAAKKACFQIVIFSWSWWPRDFTSQILNQIDPTGDIITHQQFKDYDLLDTGKEKLVMDLTLTGRMLDTSVIIDHNPDVNVKPWRNAVKLSPFTGDANDVELWSLLSFFEAQGNFMDLRNLLHVCSCAPPMPGLPLPQSIRKTLFLDLDETLISHVFGKPPDRYHFAINNFYVIKRPGIDGLLQVATDYGYEIVIFTAGSRVYASPIIDKLDSKGLIAHQLYWDSCIKVKEGRPIKDLALTGRSLDKCVIIDDRWSRVRQRDNEIMVRPFTGDLQDSELTRLLCFFEIERESKDLREAVSCVNYQLGYLNL